VSDRLVRLRLPDMQATLHYAWPEDGAGTGDFVEITGRGRLRANGRVWCTHCNEVWSVQVAPTCRCYVGAL
jgi:hypothetical protein